MPLAADRTVVEVLKTTRWKLKFIAAKRKKRMYEVLQELIDAAEREQNDEHHRHEPSVGILTTQRQ